jgi:beta-mannosidase
MQMTAQMQQVPLDHDWRFRAVASTDHPETLAWRPATVPGSAQTDLLHAHLIPEPFFADNEKRLQWISLTDWEYTTDIVATPVMLRHRHIDIVFDGLDTFADVSLNGAPILSVDNQFRSWRVDVKGKLHAGKNTLTVLFHSPTNRVQPMVEKLPYILPGTNYEPYDPAKGEYPVSQYMRKAPYSYGWDWGPKFVTMGIWRPVRLDLWDNARSTGFHIAQTSVTADRALVNAALDIVSDIAGAASVTVKAISPEGTVAQTQTLSVVLDRGANHLVVPMRLLKPERWYPNGYGAQSRYTFTANLTQAGTAMVHTQAVTGLRSLELRRLADEWGTSFEFVINNVAIFAKGANYVPMDSFPTETTDAQRRTLLTAARDTHMNMLRVWGGGFYETDSFYDLCDELGLMVWHDFMFGGALVPGDKAFQDNVQAEAIEQVERLSNHPSLTLWCGNNEVETGWHDWGNRIDFKKQITPDQRERVWQDYVVMFRDILKSAVAEYGNGVPYWPSSPSSNFDDVPPGKQDGDMHSWRVWSGAPYTDYANDHPRFLSEFGFQSMPDLATIRAFAGSDEDLASPALQNHERYVNGYDRLQKYLKDEFRPARDFASFVYLSQVMQAEAMKFAVELMRSRRPETMGTLYWQLDDCWPVASWSSIDYYGRWKALQYYAGRFYAPLLIAAEPDSKTNRVTLHVVSDELQPRKAVLHARLMRFDGAVLEEQTRSVAIAAQASTPVESIALPAFDPRTAFLSLTLEDQGHVLATNTVYFAKPLDITLPAVKIAEAVVPEGNGFAVELRSPLLVRDLDLDFGAITAKPADNFFDLLPKESRRIHIESRASLAQLRAALKIHSLEDAQR